MNNEDTKDIKEPIDPLFDLDLFAEDADGKAIAPADIMAKANQPVLVTWVIGTGPRRIKHKAVLDLAAVPYELWMSDSNWREDYLLSHGITGDEDVVNDVDARDRVRAVNAQAEESFDLWKIKADIALAAIKRDAHGLPMITVHEVRKDPRPETLASEPNRQLFGRKVVNAIMRELMSFFV